MKLAKKVAAIAVAAILGGCASQSNTDDFTLVIAHVNDTHSSFDGVKSSFVANDAVVYNEFGGYPRLLTKADQYKEAAQEQNQSFLFLHGGDAWQGSAYFKLNEGMANADLLSQMGLDAMALGNHEFDLSNDKLNQFIGSINFPVLAANVDTSADADLAGQTNLRPYVVYAFDGNNKTEVKDLDNLPKDKDLVAVFGLVLDDMADIAPNTGDVKFSNMVESAQATVDALQAKGVHNIIALTHIGNAKDVMIAKNVNGIDAIVGGHSHTLLGDFTDIGLENNGQYAEMVANPDGKSSTCIVQAGQYAEAIGQVGVTFDKNGKVKACEGANLLLSNDEFYADASRTEEVRLTHDHHHNVETFISEHDDIEITAENGAMRETIDTKYKPAVDEAYGKVIAQVPDQILHARRPGDKGSDIHGSDVAPLVAAGQYYWANTKAVEAVTGMAVDFSLVGAGGVRTNIDAGEYREGNVSLELQPFSNFMSVLTVKGSTIKQLLNETVTATLPEGAHAGKFVYGGHIRYSFTETTAHKAGKLDYVEVMTGTEANPVWTSLKDDQNYNIALNNYNATGNDGWSALYQAQKVKSNRVDLAYVDGKLTGFKVKNINSVDGKYKVNYLGAKPNCKADNTECNTDALAMIEYVEHSRPVLTELSYDVVTLNRK
ncbi:bifunctional metallophosphatase/5'-nucleotidase [Vibrio sp. SS-MA-C1-2]|uniref:bifunctional metallophosphatase/5'-nucleotidase n=1 Tax=Vibrio sp. SS-MA-C1-2 TaxID=2908646 RepID=UPI001F227F03|nr:bifunctional metallophosphatase/5'-nucleotidase [Vibrio sp. SS-MA-C1-2]UJF16933.1 bifunctional metallophosphatase/5'-nucleotidase [Vibrio sp. SS-MA-C1-2]